MQDTDFLIGMREKRSRQVVDHGIRPDHSIPRWALIINGEMGKLNHAMEDLTRALLEHDGHFDIHKANVLKIKVQEQCFEVSACQLAMLQESPHFNPEMDATLSSDL